MSKAKKLLIVKYTAYALALILLGVLQQTPNLFAIAGIRPILLVPAVVCIAMFEGEFIGGIFGAAAGLLYDAASYTLFGFYSIQLLLYGVGIGLAVIYYVKNHWKNSLLFTAAVLVLLELFKHFFYFAMWRYPGNARLLLTSSLPTIAYSLVLTVPLYLLERYFHTMIEEKIHE